MINLIITAIAVCFPSL